MTRPVRWGRPRPLDVVAVLALGWLVIVLVRCAWEGDDAYLTFRTVANWVHGYGLRWNVVERVQAYTHPLWMLLSALCFCVTGEFYYSVLALSALLTLSTVALLGHGARARGSPLAAIVLFMASSAAIDFSVSGLETPLLILLLTLFVAIARDRGPDAAAKPAPRLLPLALVTGLIGLTRLDALLLVVPALAVLSWGRPLRTTCRDLACGALPLAAWHAFSLVYYGFALPNTAYAKLHVGIRLREMLAQGVLYVVDSLVYDPVTLLATAVGVFAALRRGGRLERALGLGVFLYFVYVVRIGGDFMSGRFFVAPFVVAIALVDLLPFWHRAWPPLLTSVVVLAIALVLPGSRLRSGALFGAAHDPDDNIRGSGVADERAYYYPTTGLLNVWARRAELEAGAIPLPPYRGGLAGAKARANGDKVRVWKEVGFFGYFAGPDVYVVDRFALGDPLLARLPFQPKDDDWRVGHYGRHIPAGYVDSVLTDNRIVDPVVHAYDDVLRLITRGPVWSVARFAAIARMQLGLGPETPRLGYR